MPSPTAAQAPESLRSGDEVPIPGIPPRAHRETLNQIVDDLEGMLWTIARGYRLSDADAAAVARTAWLRLMQSPDRLGDPAGVRVWLAATARRECLRKRRASARELPDG